MPEKLTSVVAKFYDEYIHSTSKRLKIIDAYLVYVLLTGVFQFGYCCLVGTFPFNSFLSGFISTVGSFVLGVCLRLQVNPQNKNDFIGIGPERAFADFIFAHVVLHLVVMNFIGIHDFIISVDMEALLFISIIKGDYYGEGGKM